MGELLNGHHRHRFCLLRFDVLFYGVGCRGLDSDEGKQFFIEEARLSLALEVCEEQLSEVIDLDQTLLIFNHLVELLLQVVKDAVVNQVTVDPLKDISLVPASALRHLSEVVVNELAPHRHRPFHLTLLHLRLLKQFSL